MTDEGRIPTLTEALRAHFQGRVHSYADALRRLADDLEMVARELDQPHPSGRQLRAGELTARMQHEIEWGMANANFSSVVNAADHHDQEVGQ